MTVGLGEWASASASESSLRFHKDRAQALDAATPLSARRLGRAGRLDEGMPLGPPMGGPVTAAPPGRELGAESLMTMAPSQPVEPRGLGMRGRYQEGMPLGPAVPGREMRQWEALGGQPTLGGTPEQQLEEVYLRELGGRMRRGMDFETASAQAEQAATRVVLGQPEQGYDLLQPMTAARAAQAGGGLGGLVERGLGEVGEFIKGEPMLGGPFAEPAGGGPTMATRGLEAVERFRTRVTVPAGASLMQILETRAGATTGGGVAGTPLRTRPISEVAEPGVVVAPKAWFGDEEEQARAQQVMEEAGLIKALVFEFIADPTLLLPGPLGFTKIDDVVRFVKAGAKLTGKARQAWLGSPKVQRLVRAVQAEAGALKVPGGRLRPTAPEGMRLTNDIPATSEIRAQLAKIDTELAKPKIKGGRPAMLEERAKLQAQADIDEVLSSGLPVEDQFRALEAELEGLRIELQTRGLPFRGKWTSRQFVPQEKDMPMGGLTAEERAARPGAAESRAARAARAEQRYPDLSTGEVNAQERAYNEFIKSAKFEEVPVEEALVGRARFTPEGEVAREPTYATEGELAGVRAQQGELGIGAGERPIETAGPLFREGAAAPEGVARVEPVTKEFADPSVRHLLDRPLSDLSNDELELLNVHAASWSTSGSSTIYRDGRRMLKLLDAESSRRGIPRLPFFGDELSRKAPDEMAAAGVRPAEAVGQPPTRPPTTPPPEGPRRPPPGEPPPAEPPSAGGVAAPDAAIRELLGGEAVIPQLSRRDRYMNLLKRTIGIGVEEEATASTLMRQRRELGHVVETRSTRLTAAGGVKVRGAFDLDDLERIRTLPGEPTVQDVAARLPEHDALLTPKQREAMDWLRRETAPYEAALREQGIEFGTRTDIMEGGFYLPRGRAALEGADMPLKVGPGGGKVGGRRGFERPAVFDRMTDGIDEGYRYAPFDEALGSYAADAGTRSLDAYTANLLKTARTETGELLGKTVEARLGEIAPGVKERAMATGQRFKKAKDAILSIQRAKRGERLPAGTIKAIENVFVDLQGDLAVASRFTIEDLIAAGERAVKEGRVKLPPTNPGRLKELREAVEWAEIAAKDAPKNALLQEEARRLKAQWGFAKFRFAEEQAIRERMGWSLKDMMENPQSWYELERSPTTLLLGERKAALSDMMRQIRGAPYEARTATGATVTRYRGGFMEGLVEEAKQTQRVSTKAMERARAMPREEGQIGFYQLQGVSFPDAVANAANRYIRAGAPPSGRGVAATSAIGAVNNLLRGVRATADLSATGIQGLLGLVHTPRSYSRAMKVMVQSIGDKDALGKFILEFDARAAREGGLSSTEWLKNGLQMGGVETEFMIGRGAGTIGQRIAGTPIIKQSNRAFGYFGDTLRLDGAQSRYLASKTQNARAIAEASNLMTGWSKGRFLGDVGNLVQFAPRFFQSQLELMGRALTDPGPAGSQARIAFLKLIGAGTLLTVAANETIGEKGFDYLTPFKTINGKRRLNPNFMRIRYKGTDFSLFGPWDSIVRGIVSAANGDLTYITRSKSSPVVGGAWDAITGRTFMGEKFGVESFLRGLLPFSLAEIGKESFLQTTVATTGFKATPMTAYERLASAWEDERGKGNIPDIPFEETAQALKVAEQNATLAPLVENFYASGAERGTEGAERAATAETRRSALEQSTGLVQAAQDIAAGLPGAEARYAEAFSGYSTQTVGLNEAIYGDLVREKGDSASQKALDTYYAIEQTDPKYRDPVTGEVDRDAFFADKDRAFEALPQWLRTTMENDIKSVTPIVQQYEPGYQEARQARNEVYDEPKYPIPPEQEKILFEFMGFVRQEYERAKRDYPDQAPSLPEMALYIGRANNAKALGENAADVFRNKAPLNKGRLDLALKHQDILSRYFPDVLRRVLPVELERTELGEEAFERITAR